MCERERKREKGKREPRRYKLKLQEFLWPCISVSVGLGFLTNIHSERTPERGEGQLVLTTHVCEAKQQSSPAESQIPKFGKV